MGRRGRAFCETPAQALARVKRENNRARNRSKVVVIDDLGNTDSGDYVSAADTKVRYNPRLAAWQPTEYPPDATVRYKFKPR